MVKIGVRGKVLKLIMNSYLKGNAVIKTRHGFSSNFKVTRWVRQGCPLSPTLFNIFINDILDDISERGVKTFKEYRPDNTDFSVYKHERLGFLFADDLLTLAPSHSMATKIAQGVHKWCQK